MLIMSYNYPSSRTQDYLRTHLSANWETCTHTSTGSRHPRGRYILNLQEEEKKCFLLTWVVFVVKFRMNNFALIKKHTVFVYSPLHLSFGPRLQGVQEKTHKKAQPSNTRDESLIFCRVCFRSRSIGEVWGIPTASPNAMCEVHQLQNESKYNTFIAQPPKSSSNLKKTHTTVIFNPKCGKRTPLSPIHHVAECRHCLFLPSNWQN